MRIAIFSDIHANLEALEAVLADAEEQKCNSYICLGDVVGYNADPAACLERVRALTKKRQSNSVHIQSNTSPQKHFGKESGLLIRADHAPSQCNVARQGL